MHYYKKIITFVVMGLALSILIGCSHLGYHDDPDYMDNAYLRKLKFSTGVLRETFNKHLITYNLDVSTDVTEIKVNALAHYHGARVYVNEVQTPSGQFSDAITLEETGDTTVTVRVRAKDETTNKTYTVTVIKP